MVPPRPERPPLRDVLRAALRVGAEAAAVCSLPLARRAWVGRAGTWEGMGRGTSLEFQDHRPYHPGDDPRHINWHAYARTDTLAMKVFREEVAPLVDVALDTSASMRLHTGKWRRALETFCFALDAARRAGAGAAGHAVDATARPFDPEQLAELPEPERTTAPDLAQLRWRRGSLRLLVSDLLFPGSPEPWLRPLVEGGGRGVLLVPFARAEAEPDWTGELELVDCETGERRERALGDEARELYRAAYERHLEAWRSAASRCGIVVARLPETGSLQEALLGEPLRRGAVEVVA